MNRREFIQAIVASGAAAVTPEAVAALFADPVLTLADLDQMIAELNAKMAAVEEPYVCVIHPRQYDMLLKIEAREQWCAAWRDYRIAHRERRCPWMPAPAVLARYQALRPPIGELGSFEDVRIIQS